MKNYIKSALLILMLTLLISLYDGFDFLNTSQIKYMFSWKTFDILLSLLCIVCHIYLSYINVSELLEIKRETIIRISVHSYKKILFKKIYLYSSYIIVLNIIIDYMFYKSIDLFLLSKLIIKYYVFNFLFWQIVLRYEKIFILGFFSLLILSICI